MRVGREVARKIRPFRSRACWHADLTAGHCVKGKTVFVLPQRDCLGEGGGRYYLHSEVKPALLVWCLDKALSRLDHSREGTSAFSSYYGQSRLPWIIPPWQYTSPGLQHSCCHPLCMQTQASSFPMQLNLHLSNVIMAQRLSLSVTC